MHNLECLKPKGFDIYFDKNILIILENNVICHLLKTSRDNFCPPPPIFRNRQLIYDIFMYNFEKKKIVEFVVHLTKILSKKY